MLHVFTAPSITKLSRLLAKVGVAQAAVPGQVGGLLRGAMGG